MCLAYLLHNHRPRHHCTAVLTRVENALVSLSPSSFGCAHKTSHPFTAATISCHKERWCSSSRRPVSPDHEPIASTRCHLQELDVLSSRKTPLELSILLRLHKCANELSEAPVAAFTFMAHRCAKSALLVKPARTPVRLRKLVVHVVRSLSFVCVSCPTRPNPA